MKNLRQQFDELVAQGLVQVRIQESTGYRLYKYKRKVFYKNLWHLHPLIPHARGIVIDDDGNIIQNPFIKIYNTFESSVAKFEDAEKIDVVSKVNGFMLSVTLTDGKLLVTTTGTFDSDFVKLGQRWIDRVIDPKMFHDFHDLTFIFEICDPDDFHIIHEDFGVHLIGARGKTDLLCPTIKEDLLDRIAELYPRVGERIYRPFHYQTTWVKLQAKLNEFRGVQSEGVVVYDSPRRLRSCKIKFPYYLMVKFLSRGKKNEMIWTNFNRVKKIIDEEFYDLIEYLRANYTLERWQTFDNHDKINAIETYMENFYGQY